MKNILTDKFNQIQTYFRELRSFNRGMKALRANIDAGNAEGIVSGYNAVKDLRFMDRNEKNNLFDRALERDNPVSVNALLSTQPSPNFYFKERSYMMAVVTTTEQHILNRAIAFGAGKVALDLAKNPAIVVDEPGYRFVQTSARYSAPTEGSDPYPLAVDAAQKKGMNDVYRILDVRTENIPAARAKLQARVNKQKMPVLEA